MAYVKLHYSLSVAQKVLCAVNAIGVSKTVGERFTAEAWDNGREQGYCLAAFLTSSSKLHVVKVFIAQQRNSDDILVVVDEKPERINNVPSDYSWENNSHHFDNGHIKQAAEFVALNLEKLVKKYDKE